MRNFFKFLAIAPLALLLLAFALANRHNVVVSFDPFNTGDIPSPQIELPLFLVLIGAVAIGVILGWASTWLEQGRHRKAARIARTRVEDLRDENESLRKQIAQLKSNGVAKSAAIVPVRGAA